MSFYKILSKKQQTMAYIHANEAVLEFHDLPPIGDDDDFESGDEDGYVEETMSKSSFKMEPSYEAHMNALAADFAVALRDLAAERGQHGFDGNDLVIRVHKYIVQKGATYFTKDMLKELFVALCPKEK